MFCCCESKGIQEQPLLGQIFNIIMMVLLGAGFLGVVLAIITLLLQMVCPDLVNPLIDIINSHI